MGCYNVFKGRRDTRRYRCSKHVKDELKLDEIVVAPEGLGVDHDGNGNANSSSLVTLTDGKLSGVLH
ncbi:MAG: hypothetical protein ACR2OA_14885 [Rubripirellula sp.]